MDCQSGRRNGSPCVEFTWEGSGESDAASGRGWAALEETGRCVDATRRVHNCVHATRWYSWSSPPPSRSGP